MSSYLNIYIPLKEKGKEDTKDIYLVSVSRNTDLYSAFSDNIMCPFGKDAAKPLTKEDLRIIYDDLNSDIQKAIARINNLKAYNKGIVETIDEITSFEEYLEDLKETKSYVNFICNILDEVTESNNILKYYID